LNGQQIVQLISSLAQAGGLGVFFWFLIKGLRREVSALKHVLETQQKTLEVMERRVLETERLAGIYKALLRELPDDIEKFKQVFSRLRDEQIAELQKANAMKDERLKDYSKAKIRELEIVEKVVSELPGLTAELVQTTKAIQIRLAQLDRIQPLNVAAKSDLNAASSARSTDSLLYDRLVANLLRYWKADRTTTISYHLIDADTSKAVLADYLIGNDSVEDQQRDRSNTSDESAPDASTNQDEDAKP
jgi:hypothetical protein